MARDLNTYEIKLKISHKKYIFVEGEDDFNALDLLCNEIFRDEPRYRKIYRLVYEDVIQDDILSGLGKREKIERICEYFYNNDLGNKLMGFVDREYREFFENNNIIDKILSHYSNNNVIWTRGHSIENYLFNIDILIDAFQTDIKSNAVRIRTRVNERFKNFYDSILLISCALGLTINSTQNLVRWKRILDSFTGNRTLIELDDQNQEINLDIVNWRIILKQWGIIEDDSELSNFINTYETWVLQLKDHDRELKQWLCHGHLGIDLFWLLYFECFVGILETSPFYQQGARNIGSYISRAISHQTINIAMKNWASQAKKNNVIYPEELINKIIA